MATLNFPSSPALNDLYTAGDTTWKWNGTAWAVISSGTSTPFDGGTISNALSITNSTSSTSTVTGALIVTGGTGISGNVNVGGSISGKLKNYSLESNVLGNVSGSTAVNLTSGNYVTATTTGLTTWTFSNPVSSPNASGFILELTNGGSATQEWPITVKWPSGTAPTLTSSGVDVLTFITDDGGTTWRGVATMIDSK